MSDKKKGKHHRHEEEKTTKEEYAVAKFLRFGLPARDGKLHGMEVKCFIATAAVDKLLASKWSASKNKKDALFTNRASCINYMDVLLQKGLFHRADRDRRKRDKEKESGKKKKKEKEKEKEKEESAADDGVKQRKNKKEKKTKKEEEGNDETEGKEETEKKSEKKEEKKKKEKRLKLLMSDEQWFEDGDEVYVWIYDPVNAKTFIIGLLMVFGAIGLCMFPLWPEEVRIGVYYLSLAAAGFVGFILFLVVVRLILFCLVWVLTLGRHHFWFLPNLTEDVGFFESFRPLYKHDVFTGKEEEDSGKKKKKSKKGEVSPVQGSSEKKEKSSDKDDSDEFEVIKKEELDEKGNPEEEESKEEGERDENEDEYEEDEDLQENDQDEDDADLNGEESDDTENNEPKKMK